uniref:Phosphatidic acid phosphatase type 2/haloperoxidase domain-containing protein n=1 Tax=Peronospora matthiolae TaxID=2874970 RepID=A0AAV1UJG0_9STRA
MTTPTDIKRGQEAETFEYRSMAASPRNSAAAAAHLPIDGSTGETEHSAMNICEADVIEPAPNAFQRVVRRYRLLEFGSAVVLLLLALVFAEIEVHERPIPAIRVRLSATAMTWALDPSIDESKLSEQVPMWLLLVLGVALPIVINIFVNYVLPVVCQVRVIAHDTRDFLLSLVQSVALATFFTQFTKNITGRFRPSFYDMCKWQFDVVWDGVTNLCTDAAGEKEGRKSFPSGHASFAWASMLVLALYLLGRSRLNCENRSSSTLRGGKKSLMLFLCCAPILLASWIAISRCIDNWHHYSDILAGSVIGAVSALFAFNYNYGSIFSWDCAGLPLEEIHERRTIKATEGWSGRPDQLPSWRTDSDSQPPLLNYTSSGYIVDLSSRSRDSVGV